MKNRSFFFMLTFILLLSTPAKSIHGKTVMHSPEKSTKMRIGYADGNMALNLGSGFEILIQGAIQFPAEYMQKLKGSRITTLRLAIGDKLTEKEKYIFISNNLSRNGTFLYKQSVDHLNVGWNEIVLDTPFEITGEEIFIGFKYASAGEPFSMDGREDNNLANWIRLTQNEDDIESGWQHQGGGNLNLEAIIEGDALPQNDIEIQNVIAKHYAQTGGDAPVNLIARNMAAADINSIEVTYTIEGQSPVTRIIDNLSIASNEISLIPLGNITVEKNGIYNLDIRIDKVNGMEDENPLDNNGSVQNIISKTEYTNRKVLLEHFSTMNCNNCPTAHKTIEDAMMYRDDVIHVVHHAGMGTDPLTIQPSQDYLFFYSNETTGSVYAPGAMMDRTNLAPYGANDGSNSSPGPAFFPQRTTFSKLMDQRLSTPALVTLDIEKVYDPSTRTIDVSVSGEVPSGDPKRLGGNDIRLNIFLTEDSILSNYPQAGVTNPKSYYHNCVIRETLTDTWGDPITFNGFSYQSKVYTFMLPEEWVDKQMHVIAFIANTDRISSNNCQVYKANEIDVTGKNPTGISVMESETHKNQVRVINGKLYIQGKFKTANIYSTSGLLVKRIGQDTNYIPVESLTQGIYFISMETDHGMQTCKFVIHN